MIFLLGGAICFAHSSHISRTFWAKRFRSPKHLEKHCQMVGGCEIWSPGPERLATGPVGLWRGQVEVALLVGRFSGMVCSDTKIFEESSKKTKPDSFPTYPTRGASTCKTSKTSRSADGGWGAPFRAALESVDRSRSVMKLDIAYAENRWK